SSLIALGLLSLNTAFEFKLILFMQWYLIVNAGFFICRLFIRIISGLMRKLGYNTRNVAVVGTLPAGINLLKSFNEEPWLGFVVKGIYHDEPYNELSNYGDVPYGGGVDKL
ncbi:TPA: undecaprenyl-phosphate glucose phosphotransferase, partial [Escherichia coli]